MPEPVPVTMPVPPTVAMPVLALLQTPPLVASEKLIVLPMQVIPAAGVIATGAEFTVTTSVAEQAPMV